ncbi:hypothetical protein CR513_57038, partial [Mucuna pruriens]
MDENKWMNQTTFDKENVVEHPCTFKEEMVRFRALLNSTSKPLGSYGLTMKVSKKKLITISNGDHVPIVRSSNVQLQSSLSLHNVLHVLKLANNLISIHRLIQDWNCAVTFFVLIELTTGRTMEFLKRKVTIPIRKICLLVNGQPQKLGQVLKFDFTINVLHIHCLESVESFKCDVCQFSKQHRALIFPSNNKSLEPFNLIHSDVWEPTSNSISRVKWFVSFIGDCTRVTWILLMKHKYEVCQIFVDFFRLIKNQFDKSIKRLWSNNGTEFVNHEFSKFLKDNGVIHELTCVNTLQQNGVAERKNRYLLEVGRALLFKIFVPNVYWGEAVLTATYLINKLPTRVLNGISPIKHMISFFPSSLLMLSLLKVMSLGFKCYHLSSLRLFVSLDVTFNETQSFFVSPPL